MARLKTPLLPDCQLEHVHVIHSHQKKNARTENILIVDTIGLFIYSSEMNEAHSKTVHSMEQAKEHRTVQICRRTVANATDAKSPDRTTLLEIRIGLVPLLWPELLMLFDGPDHAEGRFLGELWGGGADGRVGRR
jgi:hypothetical protein